MIPMIILLPANKKIRTINNALKNVGEYKSKRRAPVLANISANSSHKIRLEYMLYMLI